MLNKLTGAIRSLFHPSSGETVKVSQQELSSEQTRARSTGPRRPNPGISVASTLTPQRLAGVLRNAADGNAQDYFILAEEMEERDLHYSSVLRTRKLTVASIVPTVEAASDAPKDLELADAVRVMLERPQIPELLFDLLDGLGKGIAVIEVLWDTKTTPWVPRDYSWVDPRFLKMDTETLREVRVLTEAEPFHGEPLAPYKYIIHQPRLKSGLPLRNGLARLVAVMYMLKSFTVRDWWAFAEKFGLPLMVGKYGNNASREDIQTLVDAIVTLASDAGCAIPGSMQIDMVETASRSGGGGALFKEMAEWCDAQTSKAVLGQTMTTDNGSSQSQANVHDRVRMDIAHWDTRQLENTLNEFLIRPFVMLNYGPQDNYPKASLRINEPEDLKTLVDALVPLIDRGMKVQMSEVRDKFGLSEPEDGADLLQPSGGNTGGYAMLPALNRELLALNRQSIPDDIDQLTAQGISEWQRVGPAFTNPVLALASEVNSYEEFLARLPELQANLAADEFVDLLARLCFQARGLGDVNDE